MDAQGIASLIAAFGPGTAIGALGLYYGFRKDAQCTALMERIIKIAEGQAVSNERVVSTIDALRRAIRVGTGAAE